MDDYIEFFYEINPNARDVDTGDISTRIDLRKKLGCKDFKWYLETVYPGLVPQLIFLFDSLSDFQKFSKISRDFQKRLTAALGHGHIWGRMGAGDS